MAGSFFKMLFGKDPQELSTTQEIDRFIESRTGRRLEVCDVYPGVMTVRGAIFPVRALDANKIFEEALRK